MSRAWPTPLAWAMSPARRHGTSARFESGGHGVFSTLPAPPAAAGHGKPRIGECAVPAGGQHLIHRSAEKGDHPNAGGRDPQLQRCGDRSADQQIDAALDQFGCAGRRFHLRQGDRLAAKFAAILHVHQQQMPGDIEDRRDTPLPFWNRDLHRKGSMHPGDQICYLLRKTGFARNSSWRTIANCNFCACDHCKMQFNLLR